jgi:conjugative relaxase-like TrwC/TraI family protein
MKLLFGQGRHPRSQEPDAVARGWGSLGRAFPTFTATSLRQEVAAALSEHNTSQGRRWNASIPTEVRAGIRTEVATRAFVRTNSRAAYDATELTGFVATASKPAQTPVAGYDLTFSPVKSVSALWALAAPEVAREVQAAHEAAVRATIGLLEREVAFTRVGKGGIRQVPVTGLVAAAFDHRDSRAGDPDLHTHVVISNKVQTLPSEGGKWLTLDGRMVFKAKVMASEHYNTRLEAELTERLGVRFTERPSPQGRRPVREIVGIDARLLQAWSTRRGDITSRQRQLAASFQADHGRAPTRIESLALAQQANLETRPDKHEPRSLREQRDQWRAEADAVLASRGDARPRPCPTCSRTCSVGHPGRRLEGEGRTRDELARRVVDVLESSRSTWQVWHVRAEALRQARYAGIPLSSLDATVSAVVDVVTQQLSVPVDAVPDLGEPAFLRRADGASVYSVHGSRSYTSAAILDAERSLLEAGERVDGHVIPEFFVDLAIRRAAAAGLSLDPGQSELVSALATSGARVQVALAPAGSGKTTAMATLAKAWRGGGGQVIGLAPTAVAADELGQAIDTTAETVAKFLHSAAAATSDGRVAAFPPIGPRTLVVIDEAGMVGTKDLAAVVDHVLERGGSVRLVGDDQQLTAVAASGIFRDLAEQGSAWGRRSASLNSTASPTRTRPRRRSASGAATRPRSSTTSPGDASTSGTPDPRPTRRSTPGEPTSPPAGRACSSPRAATPFASSTNRRAPTGSHVWPPFPVERPFSPTAPEPAPGTSSSPGSTTAPFVAATGHGSRTGTGGSSRPSTATAIFTLRRPVTAPVGPAGSSCCRPSTWEAMCSSGTPARSTVPRERPWTRRTPLSTAPRVDRVSMSRSREGATRTISTSLMTSRPLMGSRSTHPPITARARSSPGSSSETTARSPPPDPAPPIRPESSRGPSSSTRTSCRCSPDTSSGTRRCAPWTQRSNRGCRASPTSRATPLSGDRSRSAGPMVRTPTTSSARPSGGTLAQSSSNRRTLRRSWREVSRGAVTFLTGSAPRSGCPSHPWS